MMATGAKNRNSESSASRLVQGYTAMTLDEIKIRQLTNQHLIAPADKLSVVQDLCGLQAQFMANAFHSLKIRTDDYDETAMKNGLVKNWTIRGTVHIFAESDLPLFIHCKNGELYRSHDWSVPSWWNQRNDWMLTPERQRYFSEIILEVLQDSSHTRDELRSICEARGMTDAEAGSMFHSWGGGIRELCERGFMNYTVQKKKEFCLAPSFSPIPEEEAKLEIARRYFTHIAPATVKDAAYFFHTTQAQVKAWLSALPVRSVQADGKTFFYIENGNRYNKDIPDCIFLAGFDQLMLCYEKKESIYLKPEHLRGIFSLAGIVMPSVLLHGMVVGRWKKKNGKLTVELFSHISAHDRCLVKAKAKSLWSDINSIEFNEI